MGRLNRAIPHDWFATHSLGSRIPNTPFVCCKTPLRYELVRCRSDRDEWWTTSRLIQLVGMRGEQLRSVVSLSDSDRHYDPNDFAVLNIAHVNIMLSTADEKGDKDGNAALNRQYVKFEEVVRRFVEDNEEHVDAVIVVHCTLGVERTAYFVCRYMIEHCSMPPSDAVDTFNSARGLPIDDDELLESIMSLDAANEEKTEVANRITHMSRHERTSTMQQCIQEDMNIGAGVPTSSRDDVFGLMQTSAHAMVHFMQMMLAQDKHEQRHERREERRLMRDWRKAQAVAAAEDNAAPVAISEYPMDMRPQADTTSEEDVTHEEQTAEQRLAAAIEHGGRVAADPRATKTIKRRKRRRKLEKMHAKMRRGKFWEIRQMQTEMMAAKD